MQEVKDVIIIGGGVGGATVALYLARAGYKPMIITDGEIGGKLNDIELIQNYVGVFDARGEDIADNIQKQLEQSGLRGREDIILDSTVKSVMKHQGKMWEVLYSDGWTGKDVKVFSKNVVIATGMEKKKLPQIPSDIQMNCVLCDGFMYTGQNVIVVGGGSSAFTEALELSKTCNNVTLLSRNNDFKAEKALIDKVKATKNIRQLIGEVESVVKDDELLVNVSTEKGNRVIPVAGIFTYIGSTPNTKFLPKEVELDIHKHIVDMDGKITSSYVDGEIVDGLYSCGDVTDSEAKQFGLAIGQGTFVATSLIKKLSQ